MLLFARSCSLLLSAADSTFVTCRFVRPSPLRSPLACSTSVSLRDGNLISRLDPGWPQDPSECHKKPPSGLNHKEASVPVFPSGRRQTRIRDPRPASPGSGRAWGPAGAQRPFQVSGVRGQARAGSGANLIPHDIAGCPQEPARLQGKGAAICKGRAARHPRALEREGLRGRWPEKVPHPSAHGRPVSSGFPEASAGGSTREAREQGSKILAEELSAEDFSSEGSEPISTVDPFRPGRAGTRGKPILIARVVIDTYHGYE